MARGVQRFRIVCLIDYSATAIAGAVDQTWVGESQYHRFVLRVACHDGLESSRVYVTVGEGEDQQPALVFYVIGSECMAQLMGQRSIRALHDQTVDPRETVCDYGVSIGSIACRLHIIVVLPPDPGNAAARIQWKLVASHQHRQIHLLLNAQFMHIRQFSGAVGNNAHPLGSHCRCDGAHRLIAKAGFELVEEPVQGIDIAVRPTAEDVASLGGDAPKCLPVGCFTGLRKTVAPDPAIPGIGVDSHMALGRKAAQNFRDTGLPCLQRRSQSGNGPPLSGQAGQVIEDDELGKGQAGSLERPIDPRHQPLLRGFQPCQDLV